MKIHEYAFPPMTIHEVANLRDNQFHGPFTASYFEHFDRWGGCKELREKEDAPLWAPVILKPGATRRCKESIEAVTALVIDYDHDVDICDAVEPFRIPKISWAAYTTFNHTKENPRFRLIVPLSHPVVAEDWPSFWEAAIGDLAPLADQSCKDCSRIYYVPSRRIGSLDWWEHYSEDDDEESPSAHEYVNPKTGEVDERRTYERRPLDADLYLMIAKAKKDAAGIRKNYAINATAAIDGERRTSARWETFDPRAWAASKGLKTLEAPHRLWVECPWSANHSDPAKDGIKDAYFRLDESPNWFGCSHAHCADKRLKDIMKEMGGEEFCK